GRTEQAPATFLPGSDVRQFGPYAAELLRKAQRDVALSSSTEIKLAAFRDAASNLSKAVSGQWLPRTVVEHRLYQTAAAHGGFGLDDDQIKEIVSEAMARTVQRFASGAASEPKPDLAHAPSGESAALSKPLIG